MNGFSDLFLLKQIAAFNQKNDDVVSCVKSTNFSHQIQVISLETNQDELFFGTSKGKIIRFRVNNGELIYKDSLVLSVSSITSLVQCKNQF